jgi:Icc protein
MRVRITDARPETDLSSTTLPEGTLRVLQITDTHLYADPGGKLLGVNTLASFAQVLEHFRATHWPVDLLLATGDLVHDASATGYRQLSEMLERFRVPVFCLPGNHDVPAQMHAHLPGSHVTTNAVHDLGAWRFVMLDSVIPDETGGHLAQQQLDLLGEALATNERHVLVCLHHQPVDVGSAWIDTMRVDNPEALFEVLDRHQHVRGVLWGHVHQTFDAWRDHLRLMASPSTCVQFAPGSSAFQVGEEAPGFRLLALLPDGTIRTEVMRTASLPQGVDIASTGY